jgi:FkbM family methyltransferase
MSKFFRIAEKFDQFGFRPMVARLATLALGRRNGQQFSVESGDTWINSQPQATIVSPTIHTTPIGAFRHWVLDNWCWSYLPGPGDTVIDVGAGVGEEAVIFSHLVGPSGRVISIEAHPGTFACLEQTVHRSGLRNVTPLMLALGDEDGEVSITSDSAHLKNSIMFEQGELNVPMKTLCTVLQEQSIERVDLLKMNIEGAERLAVTGQAGCSDRVRNLVISCHDFLAERGGAEILRTRDEVGKSLELQGFELKARPDHGDEWVRDYWYGRRS